MAISDLRPCQIGAWQQFLKGKGLYTDMIDGRLDDGTLRALREYQRRNGIDENGEIGPKTTQRAEWDGFAILNDSGSGDRYRASSSIKLSVDLSSTLGRIADDYYLRTCDKLMVSSGTRSPAEQSHAMFDNLYYGRNRGVRYKDQRTYEEIHRAYIESRRRA